MTTLASTLEPGGAPRRFGFMLVLGALALAVVAGSAWWGHQAKVSQIEAATRTPTPLPSPAAPSPRATAPADAASAAPARATEPLGAKARTAPQAAGTDGQPELKWPLWEFRLRDPIPPRVPSLTPPTWRLLGATLSTGTWSVMVLQQGKTAPEFFTVGQELPGGFRIEHIDDEAVTLVQNKRKLLLSYINAR